MTNCGEFDTLVSPEKMSENKGDFCPDKKYPALFHVNCFRGAGVNTGFAVYAHVLIDFRLFVLHGDR